MKIPALCWCPFNFQLIFAIFYDEVLMEFGQALNLCEKEVFFHSLILSFPDYGPIHRNAKKTEKQT